MFQKDMIFYYILITLISIAIVLLTYFSPDVLLFLGDEVPQWFANTWMNLLWITLLVKPVFMILMKYSELKTLTFTWLREYLQTIKWRSFKWLLFMLLSVVYFVAWWAMKLRRLLGITTFLIIFVHAGIWIAQWIHIDYSLWSQFQKFRLLSWYIGLLMLFLWYITSNNYSIRLFKKNRKLIQYSAYLALICVLLHLAFLNFWEYVGHYIIFVIYIFLKLIEKKTIKLF